MPKRAAGILLYRLTPEPEFLLAHPGGPFWAKKDAEAWTIPKGEANEGEDLQAAARREFEEETGFQVDGELRPLTPVRLPSGKELHVWAVEGDADPSRLRSNEFETEWPPKSGRRQSFPEVDRAAWFQLEEALLKITSGQAPILRELAERLSDEQLASS